MKPTQTVLLLVIMVVMVFAITFASMYVRDTTTNRQPDDEPQPPPLTLSFDSLRFPDILADELRIVTEYGRRGHHDFWFTNNNDEAVTVGLNGTSCSTCSDVKLLLAPDAWREPLARAEAQGDRLKDYAEAGGGALAGGVARPVPIERVRAELLKAAQDRDFQSLTADPDKGIVVPPRATGVVRLEWEVRRGTTNASRQNLGAKLWMQKPTNVAVTL